MLQICYISIFFFFNDTATTEIYTLSLHDALPISWPSPSRWATRSTAPWPARRPRCCGAGSCGSSCCTTSRGRSRSEEHTSELQSRQYLVCRLLLEKKKTNLQLAYDILTMYV